MYVLMTNPKKLKKGDTVAIIATSSPANKKKLIDGIKTLENMGLHVCVMESCLTDGDEETPSYLAASDKVRLRDLHTAFADKNIKGIFVARGGYGAARLLPHVDFDLIRQNPKIFAGYSDVTALHIAINQICKLITYHAPMPAADLPIADSATLHSLWASIFDGACKAKSGREGHILTGGNLSVICASLGTPYEINTHGRILFLEEIQEPPYRIDRMLVQLKQAGKLREAAGFVLGDFSPENPDTIKLAISELLVPEGKPIIVDIPCGHCMPNLTLPLGAVAKISTESLHPLQIYCHPQIQAGRILF